MQFLLRRGDGLAGGPPGGLCRCTIRHSRTVNPPNPLRHNRAQRLSSRYSTCLSTRPGLALHAPPSTASTNLGHPNHRPSPPHAPDQTWWDPGGLSVSHRTLSSLKGRGVDVLSCFNLGVDSAEPTPVSRWSARSAARTNDLDDGPRGSAHARLESKPASIRLLCGCGATSPQLMRMGWGRAETSAAVIPSPAQRGHGAVCVQHAGSITTATAPRSGGQTIGRPRACCLRDAHAATC